MHARRQSFLSIPFLAAIALGVAQPLQRLLEARRNPGSAMKAARARDRTVRVLVRKLQHRRAGQLTLPVFERRPGLRARNPLTSQNVCATSMNVRARSTIGCANTGFVDACCRNSTNETATC